MSNNCLVTKLKCVVDNDDLDYLNCIIIQVNIIHDNIDLSGFGISGKTSLTVLTDDVLMVNSPQDPTIYGDGKHRDINTSDNAEMPVYFISTTSTIARIKLDLSGNNHIVKLFSVQSLDIDKLLIYCPNVKDIQLYIKNELYNSKCIIHTNKSDMSNLKTLSLQSRVLMPDNIIRLEDFEENLVLTYLNLAGNMNINSTGNILSIKSLETTLLNFYGKINITGTVEEWAAQQVSDGRLNNHPNKCTVVIGSSGIKCNGVVGTPYSVDVIFGSQYDDGYIIQ